MGRSSGVAFRALRRAMVMGIVLLAFVGGMALWGLQDGSRTLERVVVDATESVAALGEAREGIRGFQVGLLRFMEYMDTDLDRATRALDAVDLGLRDGGGPGVRTLLAETAQLRTNLERLQTLDDDPKVFEELAAQFEAISQEGARIQKAIDALYRVALNDVRDRGTDAVRRSHDIRDGVAVGAGTGLLLLVTAAWFSSRRVEGPMRRVLEFLESAARKDLTKELDTAGLDEMGDLARWAGKLGATLVGALRHLGGIAARIESQGRELNTEAGDAMARAEEQRLKVEEGVDKARRIETAVAALRAMSQQLKDQSDQTASSVQQILAMTQQVRAEMEGMSGRVAESAEAMGQLTELAGQVATLAGQVGASAQSVGAAASAIDEVTGALRAGAREGRELTGAVVDRATEGLASMEVALVGLLEIKESVATTAERFEGLDRELGRVGRVLEVIDDVAGRTNLLSLNAAIIAAQAGEQGRTFGVVANEIRNLAEQTAAGTREIQGVVEGLRAGGKETAEAISVGKERVKVGLHRARATAQALDSIHEGAQTAAQRLREIEGAGENQARAARQVTREILEVSEGVVGIVDAIRDQERRSLEVLGNLQQMEVVTRQTVQAVDEQSRGTELITRNAVVVSHASEDADRTVEEVRQTLAGLREDLEALGRHAEEGISGMERIRAGGQGLAALSIEVQQQVDTFRLPPEEGGGGADRADHLTP